MNIANIDWNNILLKMQKEKHAKKKNRGSEYWDKRAPSFARHASSTGYSEAFIEILKPEKSFTILDMGCGSGILAIPLSKFVKEITAVDFSDEMINIIKKKCGEQNIKNIKYIKAAWEDNWDEAGIGKYDIAIASRSLSVDDIRSAIIKLNNAARKRVIISTVVGDGPYDRRIFEAIGREPHTSTDYIYIYNLLYQMGIHANVAFSKENFKKSFDNHEKAFNSFKWMLDEITTEEDIRLRAYLQEHLVNQNGKWILDYNNNHKWAVIWWDKEEIK
jgi:SAM-dependent methyltransferase